MVGKFDVTSTAVEKGIDVAKEFLDRLVAPAAEEVGLLLRDTVALWKFKNQVRMLNKAKAYCEANGIEPHTVSLKLLCPLLENAGLEEDEVLQDKWAVLLSNLVDSEQNIQNHVFPYILSQVSANEFEFLERVYNDKKGRVKSLTAELAHCRADRPSQEAALQAQIVEVTAAIAKETQDPKRRFSTEVWSLQKDKRQLEASLSSLDHKERSLQYRIVAPASLPEEELREYELANIVRLGLARAYQETYADSQTLEIPMREHQDYLTVDLDVELQSESGHLLTELGELFVAACTEKRHQE